MKNNIFSSGKQRFKAGEHCFIIAEAGVNHNGNVENARRLIKEASRVGADAIKFQSFKAERLATINAPKAVYQKKRTDKNESQFEMLHKLELPIQAYSMLSADCRENKILFMSTPYDEESADMLDSIGMLVFKISSGDITNIPLLIHIAKKGKPIILSTGMSYLSEVDLAVRTIFDNGNQNLFLLHCTSNYPASPPEINLRAMKTLVQAFHLPVGFSDHSEGIDIAIAAVAMGATIIEKHFTLDKSQPGPDQNASLEPNEFESMVTSIRNVEAAMGNGFKQPTASEIKTAAVVRKSLVTACNIAAGKVLTKTMITSKRPGTGLPPAMLSEILGRIALIDIPEGTLISLEMLK